MSASHNIVSPEKSQIDCESLSGIEFLEKRWSSVSEKQFQQEFCRLARRAGWYILETRKPFGWEGFPDLTMLKDREFFHVELKTVDGIVSPAQKQCHSRLRQADQKVHIWNPTDLKEIMEVIQLDIDNITLSDLTEPPADKDVPSGSRIEAIRGERFSLSVTRAQLAAYNELAQRRNLTLFEWARWVLDAEVSRQAARTIRERHTPSVEGQMEALRRDRHNE